MGLTDIQSRIETAATAAGRKPEDVTLIAVSKVQPPERVAAVLEAGQRVFGENRVQEAAGRWPDFQARFSGIKLHLIGPLQTNKARQAVEMFDVIHTLDRPKLAETLARLADERGSCPDLFVQINTGAEAQKAGVLPEDADGFIAQVRALGLQLVGVMCIPPVEDAPSLHFALLAKIAARNGLTGLSMGMSADFESAIAFGATHVRVGSAIFGERAYDLRSARGQAFWHDKPRLKPDPRHDPAQVIGMQRDTASRRMPRPAPRVDKDRLACVMQRAWPVPIRDQNDVVKRIGAAQDLVAGGKGRAHHQVVILVLWIVAPQITGSDRHRPIAGTRQAVGAVKATDDPMHPRRCCAIALALGQRDAAAPKPHGKDPPQKAQAHGRDHHIARLHSRCPDLSRLTAR